MTTLDIHLGVIILWILSALITMAVILHIRDYGDVSPAIFGTIVAVMLFLWGYHEAKPETAEERRIERAAVAAKAEQDKQPRVVREADGCKVYAFKAGDKWHYFTRCPNSSVTTSTPYEECTGSAKTRSCKTLYEDIRTISN